MKDILELLLMISMILVVIVVVGLLCVGAVVTTENSKLCQYLGYDTAALYIPDGPRIDCVKTIRTPLDDLK